MLTALCIYFGIGLLFIIVNMFLFCGEHGYTFMDKLDMYLMMLLMWPFFVASAIILRVYEWRTHKRFKNK